MKKKKLKIYKVNFNHDNFKIRSEIPNIDKMMRVVSQRDAVIILGRTIFKLGCVAP